MAEVVQSRAKEAKNVVHEMTIWKQHVENELRTASEWEANWGFLARNGLDEVADLKAKDVSFSGPKPNLFLVAPPDQAILRGHVSRLATPRGATPRGATSRELTPRLASVGLTVAQTPRSARGAQNVAAAPLAGPDRGSAGCGSAGDDRLRALANRTKPPKERFVRPVLTSHELGWRESAEKFGVCHYGIKRNPELMPEM
mmetsp:Transcript_60668/g.131477  ORF Transcript_60668/g.131477 Transcript_60668/m.131477 type:complete len:200 (+) Transcript_60668:104-703(+)